MSADRRAAEGFGELLCRQVLAGDEPGIVDLRAQRAVGVDTIEDLRPFYELKLYDGPEPAVIDLTDSDVTRSLDDTFVIVVASGLAAGADGAAVRIVTYPLGSIQPRDGGSAYLDIRSSPGFRVIPAI